MKRILILVFAVAFAVASYCQEGSKLFTHYQKKKGIEVFQVTEKDLSFLNDAEFQKLTEDALKVPFLNTFISFFKDIKSIKLLDFPKENRSLFKKFSRVLQPLVKAGYQTIDQENNEYVILAKSTEEKPEEVVIYSLGTESNKAFYAVFEFNQCRQNELRDTQE